VNRDRDRGDILKIKGIPSKITLTIAVERGRVLNPGNERKGGEQETPLGHQDQRYLSAGFYATSKRKVEIGTTLRSNKDEAEDEGR